MSESTRDRQLNQALRHDTSLYDPTIHDNQIVALYDTEDQARAAQQTLLTAGFPSSSMQVLSWDAVVHNSPAHDAGESGFWGAIKSLFVPDEERSLYNTAIARGHVMLVVTPDQTMDRHHLVHVLESTQPLDFDAKLEEWRQAGYDATGTTPGASTSNTATAGHAVDAGLNTAPAMGQRETAAGGSRVRSYIIERPV